MSEPGTAERGAGEVGGSGGGGRFVVAGRTRPACCHPRRLRHGGARRRRAPLPGLVGGGVTGLSDIVHSEQESIYLTSQGKKTLRK